MNFIAKGKFSLPQRRTLRAWLCLGLIGLILAATSSGQVLPSGFTTNGVFYGWWGNDPAESSGTANTNGFVSTAIFPGNNDSQWNLYNATTDKLIQVWSGTVGSAAAYAFAIALHPGTASFSGGYVGALIDWRGNGTVDLGAVVSFSSTTNDSGNTGTYNLYAFTPSGTLSTVNTTPGNTTFSGVGTAIATGSYGLTQISGTVTGSRVSFASGASNDYATFVIAQGDTGIAANNWDVITARAAGGNTLISAFTGTKSSDVSSGSNTWSITGDYVGTGTTLQFGTLNVPDTPTNIALAGMLTPAVWLVIRRRRRRV